MESMMTLLTVQEVATRFRVNTETVRRWLRSGTLSGVKMGGDRGDYRIPASEIGRLTSTEAPPARVGPMTEERLVEIEESIEMAWSSGFAGGEAALDRDEMRELVNEVRRLQRENHLLHLSRGSSALIGMD